MRFGVEIGLRIIFSKCQCSYTPKISHLLPTTEIGQKIQFYFISHIHTINHQKKKKKGTLKVGVGFPRGSRGRLRSRSWEQKLDQRESSEAEDLSLLLTQAALAVSLGHKLDRITRKAKSPSASNSKPISLTFTCSSLRRRKSVCLPQSDTSRPSRSLFLRSLSCHHL
jgi:hypothetical protein